MGLNGGLLLFYCLTSGTLALSVRLIGLRGFLRLTMVNANVQICRLAEEASIVRMVAGMVGGRVAVGRADFLLRYIFYGTVVIVP